MFKIRQDLGKGQKDKSSESQLSMGDPERPGINHRLIKKQDVNINETQNTINLARRGGTFAIDYEGIKVKTFMVNSEDVFGFSGGTGIGGDLDDHIVGISGEFGLFSDKIKLKTIYATGGEIGNSYSIYTVRENKKGSVLGFKATSLLI